MKDKYTGKLKIEDWTSPLEIKFMDNFGGVKLNDETIMDQAMEYLLKDDLDEIPGVTLTIFKNNKRFKAINII
jgi:hypothetical protein|tara:strand:+ start:699 stop:917 length:219 start_codon:yes stop_codon:yes gene_type:complete